MRPSLIILFFFFSLISLFSINFITGTSNIDIPLPAQLGATYGTFELNTDIALVQTCTNSTDFCDECKITGLKYPSGVAIVVPVVMTKTESLFNYTLAGAFVIEHGRYTVTGHCSAGGEYLTWAYSFLVTSSGREEGNVLNNPIQIIFVIFALILLAMGIYLRVPPLGFLGSIMFLLVGLYVMLYGLDGVTDLYTRGIAITFIGTGFFFMIVSAYDWAIGDRE